VRGPKPKPVERKRREGNPGKRKLPAPVLIAGRTTPEAPETLSEGAREVWDALVPRMAEVGMVDGVDTFALEALCRSAAYMQEAARQIDAEGIVIEGRNGRRYSHPASRTFWTAQAELRKWSERFGLDPSSRTRLGMQELARRSVATELEDRLGPRKLKPVA
jgi:P27 family predicted phage terminase small subunit